MKFRADELLAKLGLAPSRAAAQHFIKAGEALLPDGSVVRKPSQMLDEACGVYIAEEAPRYVSRGALKLLAAIKAFHPEIEGRVALDLGASTGGFTDVLLEHGASKVYAVDVGTNQLHEKLRNDPRVVSLEQTNARDLEMHRYGIARGSIMKAIKSKPHRLNMLITDSCSESLRVNLKECEAYAVTACAFNPYLPPFLLKAKGNLNIHASRPETSSSHGELSWGFVPFGWKEVPSDPEARHAYERYAGTVFTNAFLQLAQGLCNPDTDYTVDAFFRKLRLELDNQCWEMKYYLKWTRQFANLEHFFGQSIQTLTRYNDDSEAFPPDLEFKSKYEEAYAKENDADATSL